MKRFLYFFTLFIVSYLRCDVKNSEYILVSNIGGTNARFAVAKQTELLGAANFFYKNC
jgi:hypothetical protein